MSGGVLVVGGDVRGVSTALDLADCGIKVTLVEESPSLRRPDGIESLRLMPLLLRAAAHPNITVLTGTRVTELKGGGGEYRVSLVRQPRYVDVEACTSCARCEKECPVDIIPPSGGEGHKAVHRAPHGVKSVPSTYIIDKKGIAPCTAACPAGINTQGYVALVSQGKFAEAFDLITGAVAFPRVLGRVCTHPCEVACTRGKVDRPVAICALKRFASSGNLNINRGKAVPLSGPAQVAIIGAGPAGLSAAYDLARMGHRSTVFEALPAPGGMITVGMPRFRLPREVRQADIADIVRLGIEIRTSTPIGPELTLDDLRRQGYRAILIAVGAHHNQKLGIAGEGLTGVINSIALLQALNLKKVVTIGRKVVVIGGGYTGIDSARTAARLRCERVLVVDRFAKEDLGANPEEIAEAEEEGIEFEYLVTPVRIIGENGKVSGVELRRMKPVEGEKRGGRRHVVPIEGSEFTVEADTVVVAAGQRPDLSFLGSDSTLTEGKRFVVADPVTQATLLPGVFAAGDAAAQTGPMVQAIAAGRRAAISIDRYLRDEPVENGHTPPPVVPVEVDLAHVHIPAIERQPMPCLTHEERIGNFEEVDLGFGMEAALREAQRCLNCAACSDCRECEKACEVRAINHSALPEHLEIEVAAIVAGGAFPETTGVAAAYNLDSDSRAVVADILAELQPEREPVRETVREVPPEAATGQQEQRIGVFVCGCGGEISKAVDVPGLLRVSRGSERVVVTQTVDYACTSDAARQMASVARKNNLTHAVVAACACCNLDQICFSCSDRRLACKTNLLSQPGIQYEFVNIREHCAWVSKSVDEATSKARGIVAAGLARVRLAQPASRTSLDVERSVLVVGGGQAGLRAAADLAKQGFRTVLVRENSTAASPETESALAGSGVVVINAARLTDVRGTAGKYAISVARDGKTRQLTAGAIVLDLSGGKEPELPSVLAAAVRKANRAEKAGAHLPGVFVCGTVDGEDPQVQGAAVAAKAAVYLTRGTIEVSQTVVAVDTRRCRACGTCETVCPFAAISVVSGTLAAEVNVGLCQGCGICVAHCPSGALSQNGCSDSQISGSLEAVLR